MISSSIMSASAGAGAGPEMEPRPCSSSPPSGSGSIIPSCLASSSSIAGVPITWSNFLLTGEIFFVAVFHRGWRRRRHEHLFDSIDHFPKNTVVTRDWTVLICKSDRRRFVGSSRIVGSSSSSSSSSIVDVIGVDQAPVPSPSPLPRSKRLRSGAKRLEKFPSKTSCVCLDRYGRKRRAKKRDYEKTSCSCASSSKSSSFCDDGKNAAAIVLYESRRRHNCVVVLISREYYSLLVCEGVCSFCIAYLKIFSLAFSKKYRFFFGEKSFSPI